jgi:hypothetical protein
MGLHIIPGRTTNSSPMEIGQSGRGRREERVISKGYIDDDEASALIQKYLEGVGTSGASEAELVAFLVWAERHRLGALLVEQILAGDVVVGEMKDGAPVVYAPGSKPATGPLP